MPLINTIEVVDRNNRPSVNSRVMLKTIFVNDGEFQDPYQISSVHVFKRARNLSPSNILNDDGLVASSQQATASMLFGVVEDGVVAGNDGFGETKYTGHIASNARPNPCSGVSGIYKLSKGEFACVLDGVVGGALSGGSEVTIQNTASGATRYIDVWTVKLVQGSAWKTIINPFSLFDDSFLTITERLLFRTKNKLYNKQVILGSKADLKIGTEITVENRNIDESFKNVLKQTLVTSATLTVTKINEDSNLASRVEVVTNKVVEVLSDNTMVYSLDTLAFSTVTGLGGATGTYAAQVTYYVLHEKIVSPFMYFIVK